MQLISLPAKVSVTQILTSFQEEYTTKSNQQRNSTPLLEDSMKEVVEGLKLYFEKAIGSILLYRFERKQYVDLVNEKGEKSLCDIYGVEHLLRLFGILDSLVQLPSLIAHTNMDHDAVNILKDHFTTFLIYLEQNRETLFVNEYEVATPDYVSEQQK
jgi:mortality factor 4-like protein 1